MLNIVFGRTQQHQHPAIVMIEQKAGAAAAAKQNEQAEKRIKLIYMASLKIPTENKKSVHDKKQQKLCSVQISTVKIEIQKITTQQECRQQIRP